MPSKSVNITLTTNANNITLNLAPLRVSVPFGNTGSLIWSVVGGASFPANAVTFKNVPPPPALQPPTVSNAAGDTVITSASYTNNSSSGVLWEYTIVVQNGSTEVTVDPEVDNQGPPGGGGGVERP